MQSPSHQNGRTRGIAIAIGDLPTPRQLSTKISCPEGQTRHPSDQQDNSKAYKYASTLAHLERLLALGPLPARSQVHRPGPLVVVVLPRVYRDHSRRGRLLLGLLLGLLRMLLLGGRPRLLLALVQLSQVNKNLRAQDSIDQFVGWINTISQATMPMEPSSATMHGAEPSEAGCMDCSPAWAAAHLYDVDPFLHACAV